MAPNIGEDFVGWKPPTGGDSSASDPRPRHFRDAHHVTDDGALPRDVHVSDSCQITRRTADQHRRTRSRISRIPPSSDLW